MIIAAIQLWFIQDPMVDSWYLMRSPLPMIGLIIAYLYFVLDLGPRLMRNREPFELKKVLVLYNGYQVLFSLWLCGQAFIIDDVWAYALHNSCTNPTSSILKEALTRCAWWYFFSKIIELLDTVFFVLRKKQSQVTFLHVYHHSIMVLFTWGYLKFLPSEQGIFIGFLNSFVHIIMYTYYLLSALGPRYQKYLWWKKYMTWIQLTQFLLMLFYLIALIAMDCKLPKALTFFFVGNVVVFLYLFSDFYKKAYTESKKNNFANGSVINDLKLE
ncbi:GNS1/SUR4 family [Popillia japonica]|uniref:Elongation of very long chain fatty acids protein n=1 Tax=Popillia japonica TaxID=7064 RepID=A0AAW1LVZ1_POPJA